MLKSNLLMENLVFQYFSLIQSSVRWIWLLIHLNRKKFELMQDNFSRLLFHGMKKANTILTLMNFFVSLLKIRSWKYQSRLRFRRLPKEFPSRMLYKLLYWQKIMSSTRFILRIRKLFDLLKILYFFHFTPKKQIIFFKQLVLSWFWNSLKFCYFRIDDDFTEESMCEVGNEHLIEFCADSVKNVPICLIFPSKFLKASMCTFPSVWYIKSFLLSGQGWLHEHWSDW